MIARSLKLALATAGVGLSFLAACPPSLASVQLPGELQQRLGLATQKLAAARRAAEIDAFAKVLDPAPLVQLDSDLRTAEAAAQASAAEDKRSTALNRQGGEISAKDAEAARAQARSDALHVKLLREQLALAWGSGVAKLNPDGRERLVRGLSNGTIALVHVDTHNNEGQAGARSVRIDVGDGSVTGRVIGLARAAEPRLQSTGLIVEVSGKAAELLAVGLTQSAHIATTSQETGVLIPRNALIRYEGSNWAYVRTSPSQFERRILQDPVPGADGYFEAHGFAAGEEVVVRGAPALFASEQSHLVKAQ
jgi:hypothetical protein